MNKELRDFRLRTGSDPESSHEIVHNSPQSSFEVQGDPVCLDKAVDGDGDDESDVEPADMLMPVCQSYRRICDMNLLGLRVGATCSISDNGFTSSSCLSSWGSRGGFV